MILDCSNETLIRVCGPWKGSACKLYAFTKQLMGGSPRTYACMQISEVKIPFTAKVGLEDR